MPQNLTQKILSKNVIGPLPLAGELIEISIDQVLLHDMAGPMAMLEFEAMDVPKIKVKRAIAFIDHNTLQTSFENMDDHRFLESACQKYGLYLSKAGNGICHQVFLERFSRPGEVLLGIDSHTTNAGGVGMFAFSAGGVDIAAVLAGNTFTLPMPQIFRIELINTLPDWVSAKDIILEILRRLGVSGGKGKVFEFCGEGLMSLNLTDRATIANMSIETGAVCGIFPSDEITRDYFRSQNREGEWSAWCADDRALYDGNFVIDLAKLTPLTAAPHSPGNVISVAEAEGIAINQVAIGSCTNSSMRDMLMVAEILKGRTIAPGVSLVISPGSRQVLYELMENGAMSEMVRAGARILETACGPCMGIGQVPSSGGISLRTFNRNFQGRCGAKDSSVYLVSPETAAVSAVTGKLTDPRTLGVVPQITLPKQLFVDDSLISKPLEGTESVELVRGPNIKPIPQFDPLPESLEANVYIVLGDCVATDDILPSGSKVSSLRSNIPAISEFVFSNIDSQFVVRAKKFKNGVIVGGENYGQGSSREHAALAPRYLSVRAVIAQSYARVHRANLINFGIIPLFFSEPSQIDLFSVEDGIFFPNLLEEIAGKQSVTAKIINKDKTIALKIELTSRERTLIMKGGLLPFIRSCRA
jgi:aconitate hydratase